MGIWKRRVERLRRMQVPPRPAAAAVSPPPDFLAPTSVIRGSIGSDAVVSGRLSFSTPTLIDGTLRGEVRASQMLVIGQNGFVAGTIRAPNLVILGHVNGDVLGADRVEIGPQGALRGAIETRALVVREGGRFDGDCRIAAPRVRVHVLRARSAAAGAAAPVAADTSELE